MIKKRSIILFALLPLMAGYVFASNQSPNREKGIFSAFNNEYVDKHDTITVANAGNIYLLTHNYITQVTQNQNLIEPIPIQGSFLAVDKELNFASLNLYDEHGHLIKPLQNGNSGNIDTMTWSMDPTAENGKIAFVSDKNKIVSGITDNALFVQQLNTGELTQIAKPSPHSGGISHPVWSPVNNDIVFFDYYTYDTETIEPYSIIMQYNMKSKVTIPLTTEKLNAYQCAFTVDANRIIFLGRNSDLATMYTADYADGTLKNIRKLASGDFAYPQFSNNPNKIYFLQANGNSGYNLYTATIKQDKLSDIRSLTKGSTLLGNSSFNVTGRIL